MLASDLSLRITEIFSSLQGESSFSGYPTTFVRLTGCPLRCVYCDSAYAFSGGDSMPLAEVLSQVRALGNRFVCVTGGEPLAQPECLNLLEALCDLGLTVSLETSGAMDIAEVDSRVKRIVDIKTPGSGEVLRNLETNYEFFRKSDELKFVITDRGDFDWSINYIQKHNFASRVENIMFSPMFSLPESGSEDSATQSPVMGELAGWILESGQPIRYQLQLHKVLWGDEPGR